MGGGTPKSVAICWRTCGVADDIPDECKACEERSKLLNKISNRECIMMAAEGNTEEEFYNKERWVKYFKDGGSRGSMEECIEDLEYEENEADYLSKLSWLKELFREWNSNK